MARKFYADRAQRVSTRRQTQDDRRLEALALRLKGAMPAGTPKPDPSTGHSGDPKPRTMADAINQHYRT